MDKRQYLRDYYLNNKERLKKQKAEWYLKNRERLIAKDAEYKKTNRDLINQKRKLYPSYKAHAIRRNPLKNKVRNALQAKIRQGKIKRLPCEVCGEIKSQAHHNDYSKPFEVNWLCAEHHAELHKNVF